MAEQIDSAYIENQIYKKYLEKVWQFNLMVVGLTGVGKSTLIASLFKDIKPRETVGEGKLNVYCDLLEYNGVELKLRCIETSCFDSHNSEIYMKYIEDQMRSYFVARLRPDWNDEDTRVHCCLYMIQPYGKLRLREEDIKCMRALQERVNLVPIIAKADTFSTSQLAKFKENIIEDLKMNGINYYKFSFSEKEDEERSRIVRQEAQRFPFAVVAADEPTLEGKKYRWIRETISGRIDIYDKSYDFDALRKLLIRHCMLDLMDSTHKEHYIKFKDELLASKENLEAVGLKGHEISRLSYWAKEYVKGENVMETWTSKGSGVSKKSGLNNNNDNSGHPLKRRQKPEVPPEKPEFLKNLRNF